MMILSRPENLCVWTGIILPWKLRGIPPRSQPAVAATLGMCFHLQVGIMPWQQ